MKLTYQQVDELNSCYLHLFFKGIGIIDSATNITKLKPFLDVVTTTKVKLIKKHTDGKESISSDHKNWRKFTEEFNEVITKEIEIPELTKIRKQDIDIEVPITINNNRVNPQGFISVLMSRNLLE